MKPKNKETEKLKEEMIETLDEIENLELEMLMVEDKENYSNNIRNKKFITNEMKIKINRLTERYRSL